MSWLRRFYGSSIGAKVVMAVTGILLLGFVVAHLLGNLQVFAGADALNRYALALRHLGPLLWVLRIGLLVIAAVHVVTALKLTRANEAARPVPYMKQATRQVKVQSRSMVMTGLVILAYVVYHLAHFTWGLIQPENAQFETTLADGTPCHDVYTMLVLGMRTWWVALTYVAAMGLLALHLWHGIPSFFQTLGLRHAKYDGLIRKLGPAIAAVIFAGYVSIPVAALLGALPLAGAGP